MKKTLILGATPNPERYAYKAAASLVNHKHEIVPVGIKKGEIYGRFILNHKEVQTEIHTITLYIGSHHQTEWYDYILASKPERLIFNPGTENPELLEKAKKEGIKTIEACTLVMLATNQY